jgi:hypothetical protein
LARPDRIDRSRKERHAVDHRNEDGAVGKGLLLWLVGVPLPVILVLWLLGFLS